MVQHPQEQMSPRDDHAHQGGHGGGGGETEWQRCQVLEEHESGAVC